MPVRIRGRGKQFLRDIHSYFASSGEWPSVRFLQSKLGTRLNARALAAEIGPDLVVCQEGDQGKCFLTLTALSVIPEAVPDLTLLANGMRAIARSYAERGPVRVTQGDLEAALGVTSVPLRRLGHLLRLLNGPWSQIDATPDGATYSFQPREDVFFYHDVSSYNDIREVQLRLETDHQRIAERLTLGWKPPSRQHSRPARATEWPKVERQIKEMRARIATAKTEEQYQAVGLLCREVLISLAEYIYDAEKHPFLDGVAPSTTDAKRRLEVFFDAELAGTSNEAARKHARAAVALTDALQHKRTADYRTAALCVEATVSVLNLATIITDQE